MINNAFLLTQKRGLKADDLVYAHDYHPNHWWTAAVVSKRHDSYHGVQSWGWKRKMSATPQPAETKTFTNFWSHNRYCIIYTTGYLWSSGSSLKEESKVPFSQAESNAHICGYRWIARLGHSIHQSKEGERKKKYFIYPKKNGILKLLR